MTRDEYESLQAQLSDKLQKPAPDMFRGGKREEGYRQGILSAKSLLHDWYRRHAQ